MIQYQPPDDLIQKTTPFIDAVKPPSKVFVAVCVSSTIPFKEINLISQKKNFFLEIKKNKI